ncbi:MAG: [FeFe] hydrogenase H-cluster radical SAM maturase HydE [Elusimicrobiota bacterium]
MSKTGQVQKILKKIEDGNYSKQDFIYLINIQNREEFQPVFNCADKICRSVYGDDVYLRGIIEFSNYCKKNCRYCGIRRDNKNITRYRMSPEEILKSAGYIVENEIKTVILQSGEDSYYSDEVMVDIIKEIKNRYDVALTLSAGEKSFESYQKFKDAGADRYLLRIETTDPGLYNRLHPDSSLDNRKKCLDDLKKLGYETGTGNMVGLPGQSRESLVEDIFYFNRLDADMVGIGPFLPHRDTIFKNRPGKDFFLTLKVLAMIRLLMKNPNIPATTAMGTLDPSGREKALGSGANVIMPNCTPGKYRKNYKLYDNKICLFEKPEKCASCVKNIARQAGKSVKRTRGFRKII